MTNNPTIDGVSRELRELLERIVKGGDIRDSSEAMYELRALLDAPAVERQADPDCEWCGGAGHDHYGDPCTACTQVEVAALQSIIAQLEDKLNKAIDLDSQRRETIARLEARVQELESGKVSSLADGIQTLERIGASIDARQQRIDALTAPQEPVAVAPEGWKLVPVEPTTEMLENLAAEIYPDDKEAGLRLQRLRGTNVVFPKHETEMAVGKYARMLDAAPAFLDATAALNGPKS